jgi:orotate phosphoribosyltransferase
MLEPMNARRIAELLLDIEAVKISVKQPFVLSSGLKSPIYCDNRLLFAHPEAREFVIDAFLEKLQELKAADVFAGTAVSGIPWAAWVADRMKRPFVFVRKEEKGHGMGKTIEGKLPPKKHVVVIEDHISTGGNVLRTVERLRSEGQSTVNDIISITTAELPTAAERAEELGTTLHPLCTFTAVVETARLQGAITPKEAESVFAYMREPEGWAP